MTKPGNSDPGENGKAVPDETASDKDATSSLAPDPVEREPAPTEKAAPEPEARTEAASKAESKPAVKARSKIEKTSPSRADEPVMPTAREAAMRAQAKRRFEEPPPRTLRISFYFFVAAGLIWLASMVISLIYKQDIINAQIEAAKFAQLTSDDFVQSVRQIQGTVPGASISFTAFLSMFGHETVVATASVDLDQIANGVTQILWIVTIAALTFTVFLGLFGYKATEGTRRARTLVTIFGTILVLFHLLLNGTPPGILSAMFCLVGLALLWSPSARRYFPPRELR